MLQSVLNLEIVETCEDDSFKEETMLYETL